MRTLYRQKKTMRIHPVAALLSLAMVSDRVRARRDEPHAQRGRGYQSQDRGRAAGDGSRSRGLPQGIGGFRSADGLQSGSRRKVLADRVGRHAALHRSRVQGRRSERREGHAGLPGAGTRRRSRPATSRPSRKCPRQLTRIQTAAMASAAGPTKENLQVYVRLEPEPDRRHRSRCRRARAGRRNRAEGRGQWRRTAGATSPSTSTRSLCAPTQELSKIELRTDQNGVGNRTGVYHVVIQLNGTVADAEAWAKTFNYDAILGVIDAR